MTDQLDTDTRWTFAFPADRLDEFHHLIAKANRKLERAGATARFEPSTIIEDRSITQPSGITIMKKRIALAAAGLAAAATILAPSASALPPGVGCVEQPWLYGGLLGRWTTRAICDGPVRADGSWTRAREFYAPETYIPYRCSWNSYGGSCWGGYWLPEFDTGADMYTVTPTTILGDEPGHVQP